ncbi:MAG: Lpg1974 family pore-forming outer membrane protein [Chlamydiota bacterium]
MIRKNVFLPLSLFCMTQIAADNGIQIPEGKITDYHCIHPDITPSAGPRVVDGVDMFFTGDYIYWTAREDNLEYASTGYTNDDDHSVDSGLSKSPKSQYKTGFKAGFGFNFGHDCWDSLLNYTWFQSNNNKSSITADYEDGLTPSFDPYISLGSADFFNSAKSKWDFHFNTIDWELGRNCYISKYLSLRPFVGLKGSWQKQTLKNCYKGEVADLAFSYHNNTNSSFWGVGIRSGLNTSWHLSESWSLYGDLALSALWSSFDNHRNDSYHTPSLGKIHPVSTRGSTNTLAPVLELAMGLRKDVWFFQDRLHIGLQAGWEEQIWWDQNHLSLNKGLAREGNLYLQGLTARLRLDF